MIQLLTGFAAKQLLQREAEHPQLAKIQALLKAYGTEYDFCRFYRQNLDENDTAYMCKLDDSGVLWGRSAFKYTGMDRLYRNGRTVGDICCR